MIRASIPPDLFNTLARKICVVTSIHLEVPIDSFWQRAWLEEDLEWPDGENKTGRVVEVFCYAINAGTTYFNLSPSQRNVMWAI